MKHPTRFTVPLLSSAVALAALTTPVFGQAKTGLNALDEHSVYIELAGRDMSDLLNRAFDVDKVPQAQRQEILAGLALQRIANVDPGKLNAKQRKDLVTQLKGNLDKTIATMKDPQRIGKLAANIMVIGVLNEVSLIEFWGEDPAVQAQLNPAAETVLKLYAQAETQLNNRMNQIAAGIRNPDDPRIAELDRLQVQLTTAQYSKMNTHYFVALSLDQANPRRKTVADEAIEYLKQFDAPDSGVQADIKLNTGKLLIAKGDYTAAVAKLKELWEKPEAVEPAPTPIQISSARQFTALAELLAGNLDAADKLMKENAAWREKNLADRPDDARLFADAGAVLQARVHWARADKATDAAEKAKHNDAASAVLIQLRKDRPQLASLIDDRIIARMPANVEVAKLDTLLLQAMIGRGQGELDEENPDKDKLTKALNAGKELIKRKGVDDAAMETTLIAIPLFAQKLGDDKEAAAGFLAYIQYPKANEERRALALDQAMGIILTKLNGGQNPDPVVADLYDKAMPIAINPPFNHKELAYTWARRMQRLRKTDEAIKYFRMVPADYPLALNAKYYLAIALNTKLDDTKLSPAERTAIASEIVKIADEVDKAAQTGLANAKDDKARNQYKAMLGGVKLTSAFVALDVQNDPKRALDLLKDMEKIVEGMPGGDTMVTDAIGVRIRAYIADGQDKEATALVIDFAQKRPNEAIGMVHQLNQRIGKEIDKAKEAKDVKRVAQLAPVRATLTEFLANWIRNHKDPKIKAQTFAADSQLADVKREAALLEDDPAKRKAMLGEVAKIYNSLLASPEAKTNPAVRGSLEAGLSFIYFDLSEYQKCLDLLLPLLRDRRLGSPYMFVGNDQVENPTYWEARYKQLKSVWEIGKQKNDEEMKKGVATELRTIYAQMRSPGGTKWGKQFEELRKEVDPTIDPNAAPLEVLPPETQPADGTVVE